MKEEMTVREIRKVLFDTNKYTVIGSNEMTNKESRDYLYNLEYQDRLLRVIDKGDYLLIY
jgi:hypothetical protein